MSFTLTSQLGTQASARQYAINRDAPVALTLYGPRSYCCLKDIQDPKLKELLAMVGDTFDKTASCKFFNVEHTFTPLEIVETKEGKDLNDQTNKHHDNQAKKIFSIVQLAIANQTNDIWVPELTDVVKLHVEKAIDLFSPGEPLRAYRLGITISTKALQETTKAKLMFKEYESCASTDEPVMTLPGVGRHHV